MPIWILFSREMMTMTGSLPPRDADDTTAFVESSSLFLGGYA
jgi:hypothetical protein